MAAAFSASADQVLMAETQLQKGQFLSTRSGLYSLVMQDDGNVVMYFNTPNGTRASQFSTNTSNGDHLRMQQDGNLALYKSNGTWAWTSGTGGGMTFSGRKLVLYETGRLALFGFDSNQPEKVMQEIDLSNQGGGPVAVFPYKIIVNGNCQERGTIQRQSANEAQMWINQNDPGGSIGYCDSPY
jgi:hypothetical protein